MPMQPDLTDDQTLFRDTAVSFIEAELPVSRTRELHDDPLGYDPSWLRKSAELGWFAMMVPEADGGGSTSCTMPSSRARSAGSFSLSRYNRRARAVPPIRVQKNEPP